MWNRFRHRIVSNSVARAVWKRWVIFSSFFWFVLSRCGFSFNLGKISLWFYILYMCVSSSALKWKRRRRKIERKLIFARGLKRILCFSHGWWYCYAVFQMFIHLFFRLCIFPHCERNGAVHHAICVSLVLPDVPSYTVQPQPRIQWVLCYFRKIEKVQNSDGKSLAWNATLSDDDGHPQPPSCSFVSLLVRWLVNSNVKWKFHNRKRQKQENFEIPNPPADR